MTTENASKPELDHETSTTQSEGNSDFFDMELPPVSEKSDDYISDEPEPQDAEEGITEYGEESTPEGEKLGDTPNGAEALRGTLDDKNGAYDPALHIFPPEKTPAGKWRRIPKKQREKMEQENTAPEPNASTRLEAQKMAGIYAMAHTLVWGIEDTKPDDQHFLMLVDSIEQHFNENGAVEIPSGINVLLSAGMYTKEIADREKNISKTKKMFNSVFNFLKSPFKRKNKKVIKEDKKEEKKQSA